MNDQLDHGHARGLLLRKMATDLYNELGVARGAKDEEIRRAYRKLAAQYHPDRNQGDEAAEQRFKRINNAYQVLSDPSKRQLYDRFGDAGLREGFKPGAAGFGGQGAPFAGGFEDIFSGGARGIGDLFADVLRGGGRGRDATGTVEVRFGDAIRGTTVELQVPGVQGAVSVRVPPGAGDGDKLRVAGKGTPGRTGAGDLLLTVKVLEHEHFRRKGLDLELEYPITVAEAVHGAKVRVPTIDGAVTLTVPVGAQSGQRVRLRGLGVKRKAEQGDLYVRFLVMVPTSNVISGPGGDALRTAAEALGRSTDLGEREKIEL